MSTNDRDTHFLGFAGLQFDDLGSLFASLFYAEARYDSQLAAQCRQAILTYLAQHGYDLVIHALNHVPLCFPLDASMRPLPDLTEWPT